MRPARSRIQRGWRAAVCLLCLLTSTPFSRAQLRDERAVRAAYVFNLTKYVEWPPETRELWIGVTGNRDSGETLQRMLEGKVSDSRPIHVLLLPSDEELKKCNIYYITDAQAKRIRSQLNRGNTGNTLTVGDADSFTQEGGMVGLVKVGDQIQIQVNLEAAQRAGIKISSRLLSLAQIVSAPGARN